MHGVYTSTSKTAVKFHDKHPPQPENVFTDAILIQTNVFTGLISASTHGAVSVAMATQSSNPSHSGKTQTGTVVQTTKFPRH